MSDAQGSPNGDFYVGYLPLPRKHLRFLAAAVPLALGVAGVGVIGLATGQPAWGDGSWDLSNEREWAGTMTLEPYPMLTAENPDTGELESYLLIGELKTGLLPEQVDAARGALEGGVGPATVRGWEVVRDGRRLITVGGAEDAIRFGATGSAVQIVPGPRELGPRETLRGEIVDSKCFMGAMKPGAGRGHKSCAMLCVSGGIPPVLVIERDGALAYYLLLDEAGDGLTGDRLDEIVPMIGEPVEVSGRTGRIGTWRTLRIASGAVSRRTD